MITGGAASTTRGTHCGVFPPTAEVIPHRYYFAVAGTSGPARLELTRLRPSLTPRRESAVRLSGARWTELVFERLKRSDEAAEAVLPVVEACRGQARVADAEERSKQ